MPQQTHHRYSPSKLERIIACPGSVRLGESFKEPETSSYAEEGTLLHAYMAEAMDTWPEPYLPDMDPEHERLIKLTLENVQSVMDSLGPWLMMNDQRVQMPNVDCEGTLDLALYNKSALHVIDFKFGAGVEVSPVHNPQLMAYAAGALEIIFKQYLDWNGEVHLHIFQPRLEQFSSWQMFEEDYLAFDAKLTQAIRLAESKNPPLHPGPTQCKWCPAAGACRARLDDSQAKAQLALASVADAVPVPAFIATNEELAKILSTRRQVESTFKAIEAYLLAQLVQNQPVPGYKLVHGRSSRKWNEGVDAFLLSESLPLDPEQLLETKLRSPAQVEKFLNKAQKVQLAEFYSVAEGPISMAPQESAKQEVSSNAASTFREVADTNDSSGAKYIQLD